MYRIRIALRRVFESCNEFHQTLARSIPTEVKRIKRPGIVASRTINMRLTATSANVSVTTFHNRRIDLYARIARLDPKKQSHYLPSERLEILMIRAVRG